MKKIIFAIVMFMMLGAFASCSCNNCTKTEEVEVAVDSAALFPAIDTTQVGSELAAPAEQPEDAADLAQE